MSDRMSLPHWRHGCIEKVRITFRGGCHACACSDLEEEEQEEEEEEEEEETGGDGRTDGRSPRPVELGGGQPSETGLSQPKCETLLRGQIPEGFPNFSFAICFIIPQLQILVNPVFFGLLDPVFRFTNFSFLFFLKHFWHQNHVFTKSGFSF